RRPPEHALRVLVALRGAPLGEVGSVERQFLADRLCEGGVHALRRERVLEAPASRGFELPGLAELAPEGVQAVDPTVGLDRLGDPRPPADVVRAPGAAEAALRSGFLAVRAGFAVAREARDRLSQGEAALREHLLEPREVVRDPRSVLHDRDPPA